MRGIILFPPVLLIAAGLGYGVCRAAGLPPYPRELLTAVVVSLLAGEAALLPALLVGRDVALVSQAGLGGTVIHMLLMGGLSVAAVSLKLADQTALVCWVLVFYWVSLATVAAALVALVRRAAGDDVGNRREPKGSSML